MISRKDTGKWKEVPCKLGKCRQSRQQWIKEKGDVPKGLFVLHRCDNPLCYEVKHLWLGTQKDNIHDAMNKKRLQTEELRIRRSVFFADLNRSRTGENLSEEHRKKISQSGKKRYEDPEERRKTSEVSKRVNSTPEGRQKIIDGMKRAKELKLLNI